MGVRREIWTVSNSPPFRWRKLEKPKKEVRERLDRGSI